MLGFMITYVVDKRLFMFKNHAIVMCSLGVLLGFSYFCYDTCET